MSSSSPRVRVQLGVCLIAALVALGPGTASGGELKRTQVLNLPATDLELVSIENTIGQLLLTGEDREDIALELLYRVRGKDMELADAVLKDLTLNARREDVQLYLTPEHGGVPLAGRFTGPLRRVKVRVDIQARLPRHLAIVANVTSGDLSVEGFAGRVRTVATSGTVEVLDLMGDLEVSQTSGDLIVNEVGGEARVTITSGDAELRGIKGKVFASSLSGEFMIADLGARLEVSSGDGDINIEDVAGEVQASSSSGSLLLESVQGSVRANSSSGDLTLIDMGRPGQAMDLVSSSGSVEIFLIPEPSLRLDLNTSSGAIRCRLPLKVDEVSRNRLTGEVGRGGALIHVVTATGDIRIGTMEE